MKALQSMLDEEYNTLHRSIRRYITMLRLENSNNEALISNFETKRWNTLRSYDHQKDYAPFVPSYGYISNIIADMKVREYEISGQNQAKRQAFLLDEET